MTELMQKQNKPKRSFFRRWQLRHYYFKRTGLYSFVFKNLLKLLLVLGAIIGLLILTNKLFLAAGIDLNTVLNGLIEKMRTELVLILFFVSESILGWIPPDLFIVWAKSRPFDYPYLNITILGTLSYLGGLVAYRIGEIIRRHKKVNAYVEKRQAKNFTLIRKWGGLIIVMAALFPLPFASISTIAGVVNYPFRSFMLFALTRYLRFYLYAASIFWGLDKLI